MSRVKFNPNFFGELGKSAEMSALIEGKADSVLAAAQKSAPVKTGRYRSGLTKRKRFSAYRVVWEVVATDPKSLLLESKRGVLARALRSARRDF